MSGLLLVAAGGAIGASLRYGTGIAAGKLFGTGFPVGTLLINVVGCLVMGVFVELLALRWSGSEALRLFVATGILGGFTTFSAFSLDFMVLWQRGEMVAAAGYVIASVVLSLVGIAAGMWIVRALA
ncbi:MAG: fluoride efflux transporter CrcB [Bauldia sp.]